MSDHETPQPGDVPPEDTMAASTDVPPVHDLTGGSLGALSDGEQAAISAAAAEDPALAAELAAFDATVAELARVAPVAHINRGRSAGIRSRLTSRAAASRGAVPQVGASGAAQGTSGVRRAVARPATAHTVVQSPAGEMVDLNRIREGRAAGANRMSAAGWRTFAIAAGLVCVLSGVQLFRVTRERDQLQETVAARDAVTASTLASLEGNVSEKDSLIASLTGPTMKVVDLVAYNSIDPVARMFWDRKTQEWTMYAYNMRQPRSGKTFQVWLIAKNVSAPISAGTFRPDGRGSAIMRAKYPMDRGALQKVAVTEEAEGGVPSPTGPILIVGTGR